MQGYCCYIQGLKIIIYSPFFVVFLMTGEAIYMMGDVHTLSLILFSITASLPPHQIQYIHTELCTDLHLFITLHYFIH